VLHIGVEKGMAMTKSDKVNKKNDNSSRSCQEQSTSGHSTPRKQNTNADAQESPNFDYISPSLILPPCTQEGGNEVTWDWQSSLRTPENKNKNKKQNVQCETPKGTKLLQRKRNSNSPLLHKPLKRKTIKIENIENIGQFAAELQALNERMRVIKQDDKNHSGDCVKEEEAPTLRNTSRETEIKDDKQNNIGEYSNEQKSVRETNEHNNTSKKESSGSYDYYFDDSVDDDIIRCTQEIEEKISLMEKKNSTHLQIKKEESCTNDISNKTSVQFSSNENCRKPLIKNILGANDNTLKTYSKLSLRRDANSSTHITTQRSNDPYKLCLNNNNTIQSHVKKPCDNKKLPKSNTVDLFDFQDDSFDDWWIAACVEEKLLSESDGSSTHKDNMDFRANYKRLTNAPLKSEAKSADLLKPMARPETSNTNLVNRKFFKTKSLSDQYVNQDASTNAKGTTNASYYATRPMNSSRSSISHTSVARAPVSTKPIVTNDRKAENNAILLMHGTDRTRGFDVNRCAVKSDGFVKHHSTGNIKTNTKEMAKTSSQPTVRCTAEEIEKKRLQAVARLEAKRKYFMKITNNINR